MCKIRCMVVNIRFFFNFSNLFHIFYCIFHIVYVLICKFYLFNYFLRKNLQQNKTTKHETTRSSRAA